MDRPFLTCFFHFSSFQNHFSGVGTQNTEGSFSVIFQNATQPFRQRNHLLDTSCRELDPTCSLIEPFIFAEEALPGFRPVSRPWFHTAVAANGAPHFSSIYMFFNPPVLGITVSRLADEQVVPISAAAVQDPAQNALLPLLRVAAVDVRLNALGSLLENSLEFLNLGGDEDGTVFVIDNKGLLVSAANASVPLQKTPEQGCDRVACTNPDQCCRVRSDSCGNAVIETAVASLSVRCPWVLGSLYQINGGEREAVSRDGETTCSFYDEVSGMIVSTSAIDVGGNMWSAVVTLRRAALMSEYANAISILLPVLSILLLVFGVAVSFLVAVVLAKYVVGVNWEG